MEPSRGLQASTVEGEGSFEAGCWGEAAGGVDRCAVMADLEDAYLSDLLSYSLERLNKEPELLKADGERVRRSMAVRPHTTGVTSSP